ncbi:hypothetical protein CORC01_01541, partial [Colletotrichum orchidophilum]
LFFSGHICFGWCGLFLLLLPPHLAPTTNQPFLLWTFVQILGIWEKALTNKTVGFKGRLVQRNGYINLVPPT